MKKTMTLAAAMSLLFTFAPPSFAGKAPAPAASQKQAATAAQATTVFDLSHSEVFSPLKGGPLNYSAFHDFIGQGQRVGVNNGPITAAALKGVRTYIIAGPMQPLAPDEIAALEAFVRAGGNLLVLLHISAPAAQLTGSFGIAVSNFTIGETTGLIDNASQDFVVTRFTNHEVTEGLEKITVWGSWGLMATDGRAKVVASTSDKAWADIDRNRKLDPGEPVQSFGIVAASELGTGKVVIIADDAPFANRFLDAADNRRLAENIMRWFGR